MAGTLIESFDNLIRENPQNRNIVIPSCNSPYASVKTDQGWKTQSVDKTIDRAFKRSAKELYDQKETINDHNERVFKSDNSLTRSNTSHLKVCRATTPPIPMSAKSPNPSKPTKYHTDLVALAEGI